jgi:hypothetical protein
MTTDDIDEAIDWQGCEVQCEGCAHADLIAAGRCQLKHACVNDRYARRIDRFFQWNPALANGYLAHPHFEVRAIAQARQHLPVAAAAGDRGNRALERGGAFRSGWCSVANRRASRVRIHRSLLDDVELMPMLTDPTTTCGWSSRVHCAVSACAHDRRRKEFAASWRDVFHATGCFR